MYRLIKSQKVPKYTAISDEHNLFRQIQVYQFQHFSAALTACHICNDKADSRHYILNEAGKEYYKGAWID